MSIKLATLGLLKIKIFWNKGYNVIISVHDVSNKNLSCDSNYTADVIMQPKFGNSNISMTEVITTSIYKDLTRKTNFLRGACSWFNFNKYICMVGMVVMVGRDLRFYTSVAKGLKVKLRKFWGLIHTFVEVTEKKMLGGAFLAPHPK